MRANPWKTISPAEPDGEYLALLSYLPLKSFLKIPTFLKFTLEIEKQLRNSKGLIGYSLQAELLSKIFWTLSVWQDEQSLMNFVFQIPHNSVMEKLASHLNQTKFDRWKISGGSVPPDWNEAKERMAKK
jgi:hypothetical protein